LNAYKDLFMINPDIIFLNHGSFGATPILVFEKYQSWQRELEKQPVEFLARRITSLLEDSRTKLANHINAEPDEIVYFPNPTTAINMVARNLIDNTSISSNINGKRIKLQAGDEILTTNHEYGAMNRTWHYVCKRTGARYIQVPVLLPLETEGDFVEYFWQFVNEKTKVIFISHITSPTALIFPVEQICNRAQEKNILCIVDGAHAPGQIPVDLKQINADIYTGACHKWLLAPKGSAFLYVKKDMQAWLDPLVVSWGYESENPSASQYIDYHEWQGTRDMAAILAIPSAIDFQTQYHWDNVQQNCHHQAIQARRKINTLLEQEPICPDQDFGQMFSVILPDQIDIDSMKERLYQENKIEVPLIKWNDKNLLRVSIQAYNTSEEIDILVDALNKIV
jgi:isopenicillin-N epimerase